MAVQRDGFKATGDQDLVSTRIHVGVGYGSGDTGAVGAIAPVNGHVVAHQRDSDGLVGAIGLPGGDKRALVWYLLRVGRPELDRKGGIANFA